MGVGGKGNQRDRREELRLNLLAGAYTTLQIILDLCIPEKELAKTLSQISFINSKVIHGILSGTT